MPVATDALPLTETIAPEEQSGVGEVIREAFSARTPVYPIGGGTSLDYGLPPKQPGLGLSLENLRRVVDYPARDMTITVEAGITMRELAETLAAEAQWLPVDVPQGDQATLGGVVATNFGGPRRYGQGTIRDYVIGITAVDGRGVPYQGGGRVVKNVAGYDFCKLLTGSLGTLGVITQITLKVKPRPPASVLMAAPLSDISQAESLLAALVTSQTTPAAIELAIGPDWQEAKLPGKNVLAQLIVGLEGAEPEVAWMQSQLESEWHAQGVADPTVRVGDEAGLVWSRLIEFPAEDESPLVLKVVTRPSRVVEYFREVRRFDPAASILSHAGSGVTFIRFAKFSAADVSKTLIGRLQPAAVEAGGHCVVLRTDGSLGELTRQAAFGPRDAAADVYQAIREKFDPAGILNPGRL